MGQENKIRNDAIQGNDEGTGGFLNKLKIWEDHFDKVKKVVDSMQPDKMHTAATAYGKVAGRFDETANLLYKQGGRLVEAWGGDDAQKAVEQMNKAYRQAQEIHNKSDTTSKALTTHGKTQKAWQQSYGSGSAMDSWVKDVVSWGARVMPTNPVAVGALIGNNYGAEDAMNAINNGTVESNRNFPPGISQDLPKVDPRLGQTDPLGPPGGGPKSPKMPGGPGGPGDMPGGPGGPGNLPGGPGDMPGGPGGPGDMPGGPGGPGNLPGGPNGPGGIPGGPGGPDLPGGPGGPGIGGGPGTDLASMPPGGGPPGLGGGGGGLPGGPPGLGGGGLGGGPGAGPGGPGLGAGPGAFGAGPGAFGKNALGAKGGMGGMGMPMGAGARGGGGDGNEHERSTWLTEDEDVWGGDDDTAPPVIG